jgi:hypothetical protein
MAVGAFGVIVFSFSWEDAASWYRPNATLQDASTRCERPECESPVGANVIRLQSEAGYESPYLIQPIPAETVQVMRGQTVTVGAWVWVSNATQTAALSSPQLSVNHGMPIGIHKATSATPAFAAFTTTVPADASYIHLILSGTPETTYLDGVVAAVGAFPINEPPAFNTVEAQSGTWGGRAAQQ